MRNRIFLLSLILPIIFIQPAQAYIDPATGSMAMQVLLGSIAAGYLFLRTHINKIFFKVKEMISSKTKSS